MTQVKEKTRERKIQQVQERGFERTVERNREKSATTMIKKRWRASRDPEKLPHLGMV
jgi:hypothetical protein